MEVTAFYVSYHVGYDSTTDVHTIKRHFFNSHEEAEDYYNNLGENCERD